MPPRRNMRKRVLALFGLALLPGICSAMEPTCRRCDEYCCEWAYSASMFAQEAARPGSIEKHYLEHLRNLREPTPCVDVVARYGRNSTEARLCSMSAYTKCLARHCSKCEPTGLKSWLPRIPGLNPTLPEDHGVSGGNPIRFYPGQVIEVDKNGVVRKR